MSLFLHPYLLLSVLRGMPYFFSISSIGMKWCKSMSLKALVCFSGNKAKKASMLRSSQSIMAQNWVYTNLIWLRDDSRLETYCGVGASFPFSQNMMGACPKALKKISATSCNVSLLLWYSNCSRKDWNALVSGMYKSMFGMVGVSA